MMYIDAFNHFFPDAIWDALQTHLSGGLGKRMRNIRCIYDLDERFRVMDLFAKHDYRQILSLGMPPLEYFEPALADRLAKLGNNGMAELVEKYPERFAGFVASLPMNSPDLAAREAERAFTQCGANGLQIHSNINGIALDDPRFLPVFEMAAKHGKPVLLHPVRGADMPDYKTETRSEYEIWWTFGWPYDTSVAMARLVFSGIFDRMPGLKMMAHHLGAMVPYFAGRVGPGWDQLGARTDDRDLGAVLKTLKKRPLDYFKDFYADTAVFGSRAATVCGLDFYGADKVLFASDSPFDPEKGPGYIRDTIAILESLDLSASDRDKICFRNAQQLFGLKAS